MLRQLQQAVTLVGPAFVPIGRGEEVRCVARALKAVCVDVSIRDVSWYRNSSDEIIERDIGSCLVETLSPHFNIFLINGNAVEPILSSVGRGPGFSIVVPQWELSIYPGVWGEQLDRFDEIWAPTRFVLESLRGVVTRPLFHLPMPVEVGLWSFLGRRYFGLPESSFIFMFLFHLGSQIERKNPFAVISAFRKVCSKRPYADLRLLIKVSGQDEGLHTRHDLGRLMEDINGGPHAEKIIIVDKALTDNEIKNLIRCSDCYVSLHRSEGFGRGLAEAMCLGKPVVATAYSGNLDFMNDDNSLLVDYKLIKVREGTYFYPEGQVWADPDIDQAAALMLELLDDPDTCLRIGQLGSRYMRTYFGYRPVGLRYEDRLNTILRNR